MLNRSHEWWLSVYKSQYVIVQGSYLITLIECTKRFVIVFRHPFPWLEKKKERKKTPESSKG